MKINYWVCAGLAIFVSLKAIGASATGLPAPMLDEMYSKYLQANVNCIDGGAYAIVRGHSSIELLSFIRLKAIDENESKLSPITCSDDVYQLNGKTLTNVELTVYALSALSKSSTDQAPDANNK